MRQAWYVWLAAMCWIMVGLAGCGGGGGGSDITEPATGGGGIQGRLALGASQTLVAGASVSVNGGTVTVAQPGNPFNGTTLAVPAGTFEESVRFTLRSQPITGQSYGTLVRPITPLLTIENGDMPMNAGYMRLTLPVQVSAGESAVALLYDPATGTLEVLSPLASTATSLTVALTRCAPPAVLTAANPTGTGGAAIFVTALSASAIPTSWDTGFRTSLDTWTFDNSGTVITPGGQCLGNCITMLYHFVARRATHGRLYNRYDNPEGGFPTPKVWQDDSTGLRLAATAQRTEDSTWSTYITALKSAPGDGGDRLTWIACAYALRITGRPQLISLYDNTGRAHAVLAYRKVGTKMLIADPQYPTDGERGLVMTNGIIEDYREYTDFHYQAPSSVVDWTRIRDLWAQCDAGTVGRSLFPGTTVEWQNSEGQWQTVTGVITPLTGKVRLRAETSGGLDTAWIGFTIYEPIDQAPVTSANGRLYTVSGPEKQIGLNIVTPSADDEEPASWVDFTWVTVRPLARLEVFAPSTELSPGSAASVAVTGYTGANDVVTLPESGLTWTSSNTASVRVQGSGREATITTVEQGQSNITVTESSSGLSASVLVRVQ